MNKLEWYFAVLIGLFLILAFYVGSTANIATAGGVLNSIALTLQGRDRNGKTASYARAA